VAKKNVHQNEINKSATKSLSRKGSQKIFW